MPNMGELHIFTEAEAAQYLRISRSLLRQSRRTTQHATWTPGPPFVKIGRAIRYLRTDLDAWLLTCRQTTPPAGGPAHE